MQKRIFFLMLMLATVVGLTTEHVQAITVHTIGDSTMSSYDQSIAAQAGMDGWGDFLGACLNSDQVTVKNWADRGETARSYYNGIWLKTSADRPEFGEPVGNKVKAGDYVILQFGHNDSKAYDTATYEEWIGRLVDAVREKGATPIIASSICRARFGSDGKVTRLGRIDTGDDHGVGEDDHTYDYPYHARLVAEAKGVQFIDVTTAVKQLFESYGEAKTKALFPSGEKTHTNQLGAQLIAKVVAQLLLDTALKDYVNTEALTLPDKADIAVVVDNFGTEAVVTKQTIWTFDNYKVGTTIADATNTVVSLNGLYARGGTSRTITAIQSPLKSVTFSNGTTLPVSIAAQMLSHTSAATTIAQNTAGRTAANALAPTFALNVGTPGTFYAIVAPTQTNDTRLLRLLFSGQEVSTVAVKDAYAASNHLCELSYHAETTGVIYLSCGVKSNVFAMMFVPDMEAGTEEDWNYQMLKTRSEGWWTYTNMSGTDQAVPQGLTAYAVTAVKGGKAVLTDIGGVIPAGMGVMVKGEANTEYAMPTATTAAEYAGNNLLTANTSLRYLPATDGGNTNYYFDGQHFVKATGGETIHEKQAYLSVASSAQTLELTTESSASDPAGYYVSTTGSDANDGRSRQTALATLGKAQQLVLPGDNVYILPGTYTIDESQISTSDSNYKVVFNMNQQGTEGQSISFIGLTENGQRPVFDFSKVNPSGFRVTAFLVSGKYLVFRNFETIGVQVNITDHTQSENFRVTNGSYCTFDNLATHDGMGIGFYLTKASHHNLFLNCDSYNNYDSVSENGLGGQNDGFGCHVSAGNPENIFLGCRAWNNADDGYDLINCYSPVTFCYSFAYKNGYDATNTARGDGNGFKAGGYGMKADVSIADVPCHYVHHCIATYNKANGFYANHHLGGLHFSYNSAYKNKRYNYAMVNRKGKSMAEAVDVDGYDHNLHHNLSVGDNHITATNAAECTVTDNSFYWNETLSTWLNNDVATANFASTNIDRIVHDRQTDGMLSTTTTLTFMKQNTDLGLGCTFDDYQQAIAEAKKVSGAEAVGGSATIVPVSNQQQLSAADNAVYDLQGRRVSKMTRGFYIVRSAKGHFQGKNARVVAFR